MLRKVTLALVAAASLGAMALAPTAASAGGVFWPNIIITTTTGVMVMASASALSVGGYDGCYVTRRVLTPFGFRVRTVNVCY